MIGDKSRYINTSLDDLRRNGGLADAGVSHEIGDGKLRGANAPFQHVEVVENDFPKEFLRFTDLHGAFLVFCGSGQIGRQASPRSLEFMMKFSSAAK